MQLQIKHQETYSRGELLLRSFFGWIYIYIPHGFLLGLAGIWSSILTFIAWWSILFTGRYPQSFYEWQVGLQRWSLRLSATSYNLVDGYPAFWTKTKTDNVIFEMPYPENLSRGTLLLKTFFGILYCSIPHMFVLFFRMLWGGILGFLAWWIILFTGKYPASWHSFNVGTLRWLQRVSMYMSLMTDDYPPFSGRE